MLLASIGSDDAQAYCDFLNSDFPIALQWMQPDIFGLLPMTNV